MSDLQLPDLLSFMSRDVRLDIKCTALKYVLGLTGSQDGKEWIQSNEEIFVKLLDLFTDQDKIISKEAHLAVVNLSAEPEMGIYLSKFIPHFLHHLQNPEWINADKLCTILSNLSRYEDSQGLKVLFQALTDKKDGDSKCREGGDVAITLYRLVDIFDRWKVYNKNADFHYLASVFLNLSQLIEARLLFLDRSKCILPRLLPYTHFADSRIRRGGIVGLLKNLCFEVGHHKWFLSEKIDILPSLLLPLAGPEQFEDEEEMEKLPDELQYLPDDKQREQDPDIRKMLLEALTKLCCTRFGRDFLREKQAYLILRELHKWEEDMEVKETCETLVHILIADETGIDNWNEINAEDDSKQTV